MFLTVGFIIAVGIAIMSQYQTTEEVVKTTPEPTGTTTPIMQETVDVIEEARRELERINNELDAEETRLLEERGEIDSRLEEIRKTRMSFQ